MGKKGFDVLEEKLKVGRKYIATAVAILLIWMALGLLAPLVVNVVAFTYPAIQSIKSLECKDSQLAQKWLTYWIVYGCFSVSEFFVDIVLSWFPMYFVSKMAFLVWCMRRSNSMDLTLSTNAPFCLYLSSTKIK